MSDSASSLRNQADRTVDELKALLREAEEALAGAGGAASEQVQALRGRLRDALDDGRSKFKNLASVARKQAVRADEMIHSDPYPVIAMAAGVGLVVGYLICRSSSGSR